MGDYQSSGALRHLVDGFLNLALSFSIMCACSLIEAHDRSSLKQSSSDSYPLLLSSRQLEPPLSNLLPVPHLFGHNEVVNTCSLRGRHDPLDQLVPLGFIINHILNFRLSDTSIGDIIHDSIVKQNTVLGHNSNI